MVEYYDFIRIYGTPENPDEEFQGMGAAGTYNAPESQPISGQAESSDTSGSADSPNAAEKCPELLWKAQDFLLERQISFMKDIQETYADRRKNLQGFSMSNFVKSKWFKWAVESLLKLIPGEMDDAIYQLVQDHGVKVIGWCLEWLQKAYYAGSMLCAAMADENAYLKTLTPTLDHYRLRSQIITQHDQSMQSMLQQVALAEKQVSDQKNDVEKEYWKREALSERVFECPYSGLCLGEKNGVADTSEFSISME